MKIKVVVDTGMICGVLSKKAGKVSIPIKRGLWKVDLELKTSWNGPLKSVNYIDSTEDQFLNFKDFGLGDNFFGKGAKIQTGGDGVFFLYIKVKKIKKLPKNPKEEIVKSAKLFLKENKNKCIDPEVFYKRFMTPICYKKVESLYRKANRNRIKKELDLIKTTLNHHKQN